MGNGEDSFVDKFLYFNFLHKIKLSTCDEKPTVILKDYTICNIIELLIRQRFVYKLQTKKETIIENSLLNSTYFLLNLSNNGFPLNKFPPN